MRAGVPVSVMSEFKTLSMSLKIIFKNRMHVKYFIAHAPCVFTNIVAHAFEAGVLFVKSPVQRQTLSVQDQYDAAGRQASIFW